MSATEIIFTERIFNLPIGVPPKKGASETFGTDVIFGTAWCSVVLQPRIY